MRQQRPLQVWLRRRPQDPVAGPNGFAFTIGEQKTLLRDGTHGLDRVVAWCQYNMRYPVVQLIVACPGVRGSCAGYVNLARAACEADTRGAGCSVCCEEALEVRVGEGG